MMDEREERTAVFIPSLHHLLHCLVILPRPVPFLARLEADLTPLLGLEVEILVYNASTNAVVLDKSGAVADRYHAV
jgi:hypothetical protein